MFLAGHGAVLPQNPAARRASTIASRKSNHQLARRLAGDYETVAARPLERQISIVIGGLAGIQEETETANTSPSDTANNAHLEPPGSDEGNVMETLKDFSYQVGFKKKYDICRLIGKGRYATVHDCHDRVTGVRTAVKIYVIDKWEGSDPKLRSLHREVAILRKLRDAEEEPHPSILKLTLVFADYRRRRLFMLTECTDDGTLFDVIIEKDSRLSE
jgi:serine/threonine protein kinase